LAITIDDPTTTEQPHFTWQERSDRILATLDKYHVKAAIFVCSKRIDSDDGRTLIRKWDDAGHMICNHSYSHIYFNAPKLPFDVYAEDFRKGDKQIETYKHYTKLYRYPYLKEGDTAQKRDDFRALLAARGYRNGAVTIDASDWAIDDRLRAKFRSDPKADTIPYRDFFITHILDRAGYYDKLSNELLGRSVKHTLLLHHTLLNALYLGDLIEALQRHSWKIVAADEAFADPIFSRQPKTLPAGESLLWALAKESGRYEGQLRYPGEDEPYEKPAMDKAGL
jgi:peptidoglycan/xylan/chitin deacetylase (PgdA/CDA1 family)